MEAHHDAAADMICVVSDDYLKAPYSTLERKRGAVAGGEQAPGFVLLVVVEQCRFRRLARA
jgi:hypothetical protein